MEILKKTTTVTNCLSLQVKELAESELVAINGGCSCYCKDNSYIGNPSSYADCDRVCKSRGKGGAAHCW